MNSFRGLVALENAVVSNLHSVTDCWRPDACWVHNPSDWPLRDAPLYAVNGVIYRACAHLDIERESVGLHPDVDDRAHRLRHATLRAGHGDTAPAPCCPQRCCGDECSQ